MKISFDDLVELLDTPLAMYTSVMLIVGTMKATGFLLYDVFELQDTSTVRMLSLPAWLIIWGPAAGWVTSKVGLADKVVGRENSEE